MRQLAQQIDGVSLNGQSLFGGKKRRAAKKSGAKKSGAKRVGKKSGAKKSGKKSGKKRSGKKSTKKSLSPSFGEQLITLANALQKSGVTGGKPKRRGAKKSGHKVPAFTSLL